MLWRPWHQINRMFLLLVSLETMPQFKVSDIEKAQHHAMRSSLKQASKLKQVSSDSSNVT